MLYKIGALIELPRAALCAGNIAEHADLIHFGTNDLTQTTFGFSKADAQRYVGTYLSQGILSRDPFVSIDQEGVGYLIDTAIPDVRQIHPNMVIGICGEHTQDAESIRFFHSLHVDHISCDPQSIGNVRQPLAEVEEVVLP